VNANPLDTGIDWPYVEEWALPARTSEAVDRCAAARLLFMAEPLEYGELRPVVIGGLNDHPWMRMPHPQGPMAGEYLIFPYPDFTRVDWKAYGKPLRILAASPTALAAVWIVTEHLAGHEPHVPGRLRSR
jgi:hypothetical protein